GTSFRSCHASSRALPRVPSLPSVKTPIRGGWSAWPPCPATSATGPESWLPIGTSGVSGPALVRLDQLAQIRPAWPPAGQDVAGRRLRLLDVDVRVQGDAEQVVAGVACRQAVAAPVVGDPDLVYRPPLHPQRPYPVSHQDPGLDRGAGGHDGGPATGLQPALGGQARRDL